MSNYRFSRKRGRPRSSLKDSNDRGTPEFLMKQAAGLTADILDILHRAGKIDEGELHEALKFRRLYFIRYGNPSLQAMNLAEDASSSGTARERDVEEAEYRLIIATLREGELLKTLIDVVIFGYTKNEEKWLITLKQAIGILSSTRRQTRFPRRFIPQL